MSETSNIGAVMSVPRVGFTETFDCAASVCRHFNIPLHTSVGVFWGQKLEIGMEACIRTGKDWLLTIDYDSVFLAPHLNAMFDILHKNPDIDALAPVQIKRFKAGEDQQHRVLCSIDGKELPYNELDHSKETTKVSTAHFGLTLIKVPQLLEMPKPWFYSRPGPTGFWKKGEKIDDDIYFWTKWKECGHSLHIANNVVLGHLETFVIAPNTKTGEIQYLTSHEYRQEQREHFKQANT